MTIINLLDQRTQNACAIASPCSIAGNDQTHRHCARHARQAGFQIRRPVLPLGRILDPITRKEIHLPPSGFVAGIYARNDVNRGGVQGTGQRGRESRAGF